MRTYDLSDTVEAGTLAETVDPTKHEAAPAERWLADGTMVGQWLVCRRLSSGAQAQTYVAESGGGRFVLKLYHDGFVPMPDATAVAEAGADHHVAPLRGKGYYDGRYFETYPYYKAGTLATLVDTGRCNAHFVENVLLPCLDDALSFLQSRQLVHADVKPDNIFLTDEGTSVVLGDLGVATTLYPGSEMVAFRGSIAYAPRTSYQNGEVRVGRGYDYGSLGLVLLKACSGSTPLEGVVLEDRERAWRGFSIPASVPSTLAQLIARLTENDGGCPSGHELCQAYLRARAPKTVGRRGFGARRQRSAGTMSAIADDMRIEFGYVDGKMHVANNAAELLALCERYWATVPHLIDTESFKRFVNRIDDGDFYAAHVAPWRGHADDVRTFMLCCGLRRLAEGMGATGIGYAGDRFESVLDLLEAVRTNPESRAAAVLTDGLLPHWLEVLGYGDEVTQECERALRSSASAQDGASVLLALFAPTTQTRLEVAGSEVKDIGDLLRIVRTLDDASITKLIDGPQARPWLYSRHCGDVYEEVDSIS